ncbi:GGDEF domain-containing protein [Aestuariivirga sp.]|uniref:GGDEF domain-containing protein n=1 Tax=Aestuariivirga sp. TaxID=2650926 RepID=UPI003593BDF9
MLRITNKIQVAVWLGLAMLLSVSAPFILLWLFLPPLPLPVELPIYVTRIAIPLLIVTPMALIVLVMFLRINQTTARLDATIARLDAHVKFDSLTGLLARGYFLSAVEQTRGRGGYFLMIDADHFKSINDNHGHHGGDAALMLLARVTMQAAGEKGLAGRLGGEEFGIYMPGVTAAQAELLAAGLGAAVRNQNLELNGKRVPLSVSVGVAHDEAGVPLSEIMKAADEALYQAKAAGRDRFVMASRPAHSAAA